ncbi:uncharacterized protein LOC114717905 [Neltuma alba]|uniref:uncharacterized protein LOC114717905 n=1 Tax=Neltuma alba TaxID=207710 RepID=UPI0010A34413|nr:uncharacterized protein LOC114717905 [Prosopis alba]
MEKKNQDVKPKSLPIFKSQLNLYQNPCPGTPKSSQDSPNNPECLAVAFLLPFDPNSASVIETRTAVDFLHSLWIGHGRVPIIIKQTFLRGIQFDSHLAVCTVFYRCNHTSKAERPLISIALDLLQRCRELIFAADNLYSTIEHTAFYLSDSLNKCQLRFWKQWVYHYIKIPPATVTNQIHVDMQSEDEMSSWAEGMKEIHKLKLQHTRATEILELACNNLTFLNEDKKRMIGKALLAAAISGNLEFCKKISIANPELISMVTFSQQKENAFFSAVKYRQAEIFNLLRGIRFKNVVATMLLENYNNLLHTAANLAPPSQLYRIPGAALRMQRNGSGLRLEAVESMVNLGIKRRHNKDKLTPLDYFKENHKELRNNGEKWMKDTATSCSIVGALIVTIMFAVAFTVPGGNDQTSGHPIFLKETWFRVFLISDTVSLFASASSVLIFLGILTSRYAEDDFLYSLPGKLIIGLIALFLSVATMLIAFSSAIIIMSQQNSSPFWAFLPVLTLAIVPITIFVLLQFPLLVEIIYFTYWSRHLPEGGEVP